jgi:hypothetical protein
MSTKKIVILLHERDETFFSLDYVVHLLMKEWNAMGIQTEVVRGVDRFVPGDVLVPHIDLTVLPREYVALFDRYPVVINRRLTDILKSHISGILVRPGDPYTGKVIVKTDLNSGGIPERYLCGEKRARWPSLPGMRSKAVAKAERMLKGWKHIETLLEYPVYDSLQAVPPGVFENKNLVVEKFQPEMEGEHYCLRHYTFFGGRAINRLSRSKKKIVKGANLFQSEDVPAPVAELDAFRAGLGMDFGRFDYVLHGGKHVVFDVNRTPSYKPADEFFQRTSRLLAEGIHPLLAANIPG